MSLLPDSIRKLCDKCTLFSNRCAGVRQRRRSAAHVRRCVYPRRCRGLTEGVTARAVGVGAHPRSAYRWCQPMPYAPSAVASCGWGYAYGGVLRRWGNPMDGGRWGEATAEGRGSGVPPARRGWCRGESRHATLRFAYRVTEECRRSATRECKPTMC